MLMSLIEFAYVAVTYFLPFLKKWQGVEICLGRWPTIPVSMLDYRDSVQIMYVTNIALTMKLLTMYTTPNIFINIMPTYNCIQAEYLRIRVHV